MAFKYILGHLVCLVYQNFGLLIHHFGSFLAERFGELVSVFLEVVPRNVTHFVAHSVIGHHRISHLGKPLKVVEGA